MVEELPAWTGCHFQGPFADLDAFETRHLQPPAALFRMELSSACFSRITYTGGEAAVRLLNDTSHLG